VEDEELLELALHELYSNEELDINQSLFNQNSALYRHLMY